MRYYLPDSRDAIDPTYNFETDSRRPDRVPRDDIYAHEALELACDGFLVSYAQVNSTYPLAARRRLLRSGAHEFYRLRQGMTIMGDCGAFAYVNAEKPPFTVDEIADFYQTIGVNYGIAVDHIVREYIADGCDPTQESRTRYALTLELAAEFISCARECSFEPLGAVQGWSASTYADAAVALQRMGYRYLALGGLVRLRPAQLEAVVQAVSAVRNPDTRLHLLGIARPGMHEHFARLGVASVDSTGPLRSAWMHATKNYTLNGDSYSALRIPSSNSPRVRKRIESGELDQSLLLRLEESALLAVKSYAHKQGTAVGALNALLEYQRLHSPAKKCEAAYARTLADRPWERCRCRVCTRLGYHVILFRGAERNRGRGFHNVGEFYRSMLTELGEPSLILVGCGLAKAPGPAPAADLYTGSLFRASCTLATAYRAPVRILSALHGLIEPWRVIDKYDETLTTRAQREIWGDLVIAQLRQELPRGGRVIALAGARYLGWIRKVPDDITVETPLAGKVLGERLALAASLKREQFVR